jgi:adenine C2-methylase RlmN of 23S rRNA A2503 and tRNA A37
MDATHYCSIEGEMDGNPWYHDIKQFIQHQKYPTGASNTNMKTLQRLAIDYYLDAEVLYKRSSNETLLRCLDGIKAKNSASESSGCEKKRIHKAQIMF